VEAFWASGSIAEVAVLPVEHVHALVDVAETSPVRAGSRPAPPFDRRLDEAALRITRGPDLRGERSDQSVVRTLWRRRRLRTLCHAALGLPDERPSVLRRPHVVRFRSGGEVPAVTDGHLGGLAVFVTARITCTS
jgi:hypothetical protein